MILVFDSLRLALCVCVSLCTRVCVSLCTRVYVCVRESSKHTGEGGSPFPIYTTAALTHVLHSGCRDFHDRSFLLAFQVADRALARINGPQRAASPSTCLHLSEFLS